VIYQAQWQGMIEEPPGVQKASQKYSAAFYTPPHANISSCADGRASKLLGSAKVFTLSRHLLSVLCSLTISPRIVSLVAEKHLIFA
jgi:hypothetical protein